MNSEDEWGDDGWGENVKEDESQEFQLDLELHEDVRMRRARRVPVSLVREVSPPGVLRRRAGQNAVPAMKGGGKPENIGDHRVVLSGKEEGGEQNGSSAAVEAGAQKVRDHVQYWISLLSSSVLEKTVVPKISVADLKTLYLRNENNPTGHHFVIHQHDHPVAGLHYDLRLQINETSSVSWAIMYGFPGDANSRRLNRNATETRIHNLWNHLIETASLETGSLLIWDCGEYEVLERRSKHALGGRYGPMVDPDSESEDDGDISGGVTGHGSLADFEKMSEPEKLKVAFLNRKIKLRFHGTRLPRGYTINLSLPGKEDRNEQPKRPKRKKRRKNPAEAPQNTATAETSDEYSDEEYIGGESKDKSRLEDQVATAYEKELREIEDEKIRLTNAYPGATNSISSIHQRKWFLNLDRTSSGFYRASQNPVRWERRIENDEAGIGKIGCGEGLGREEDIKMLGFESFRVRGRDVERSVITGRTAEEVMTDEGVVGFVGRKGWRPVLE